VDLVLDTVGSETQERSWAVLQPGGLLISLVHLPSQELAAAHQTRGLCFLVRADHEQLGDVAGLIDSGRLKPLVAAEFPRDQAHEAFVFASRGHRGGKTILRVAD
jgi:NADPH:quinone reductase-like Zn-dependent oxidoreductase